MSLNYLIDTDWVVHYFKGRQAIVTRLNAVEDDSLAISVVTLAELYDGLYGSHDPRKREQDLKNFLQGVTVLGLDEETCRLFGQERSRLPASGKPPWGYGFTYRGNGAPAWPDRAHQ